MAKTLAAYDIVIDLYFDSEFMIYLEKNKFAASNGIRIEVLGTVTPGFANGTPDTLYMDYTFSGKKRSLVKNFSNLELFLKNQERIFKAIKEAKEQYLASFGVTGIYEKMTAI